MLDAFAEFLADIYSHAAMHERFNGFEDMMGVRTPLYIEAEERESLSMPISALGARYYISGLSVEHRVNG